MHRQLRKYVSVGVDSDASVVEMCSGYHLGSVTIVKQLVIFFNLANFFVFVCTRVHLQCMGTYGCMYTCVSVHKGPRLTSGVFLCHPPPCILRQGLLLKQSTLV